MFKFLTAATSIAALMTSAQAEVAPCSQILQMSLENLARDLAGEMMQGMPQGTGEIDRPSYERSLREDAYDAARNRIARCKNELAQADKRAAEQTAHDIAL